MDLFPSSSDMGDTYSVESLLFLYPLMSEIVPEDGQL
jgi:hypothetical protein